MQQSVDLLAPHDHLLDLVDYLMSHEVDLPVCSRKTARHNGKKPVVLVECLVIFEPVFMRETWSQGAGHGLKEEAHI